MRRRNYMRRKKRFARDLKCPFCESKKEKVDYKEPEVLTKYLTDRGKIIGRSRTGLCAKHQRRLTREIKRARHLALLPFLTKV